MSKASDSQICAALSAIAQAQDPKDQTASGYGVNFNTPIFSYHRYCWCESESCPWCAGCDCPPDAWTHYKDGVIIPATIYNSEFLSYAGDAPMSGTPNYHRLIKEWHVKIDERNKRYKEVHTPKCNYCLGTGPNATIYGAEPGKNAPNFWHRPTNFKVWFYKYIGRSQETNRKVTIHELNEIVETSIASFKT
jgi:hypothetical protein